MNPTVTDFHHCKHPEKYVEEQRPHNTDVKIFVCTRCGKELSRVYLELKNEKFNNY